MTPRDHDHAAGLRGSRGVRPTARWSEPCRTNSVRHTDQAACTPGAMCIGYSTTTV
jgi:hypothetical protein